MWVVGLYSRNMGKEKPPAGEQGVMELDEWIKRKLAEAPPLTTEQRLLIRSLFSTQRGQTQGPAS